ncbi:MAG: hypothetical protein JO036_21570 [Candidatus Eremiobacteraeota bacterium]|nr:hypothetical protein [Candidatus Eremiobacteraeota bacterium]
MIWLLATGFLSLGLVNLDFSRGWWRGQLRRLVVGVPLVGAFCYLTLPQLVFPQAISLLLLTLLPNALITSLTAARTMVLSRRIVSLRRTPVWPLIGVVGVVGLFALGLLVAPVVDASGLRDLTGATVSTAGAPAADPRHVRVVPEESAIFAGEKVVGQLGAYYRVGTYNVQSASGHLVWVAPLNFQGFVQWLARHTSPGVVIVDAENPDAPAELRTRAPLRYVPSALFNDNLRRHVWLRYGTELLLEETLQLDDRGDPRYLVTLGRPTIGWSGEKVTAVVIVDPTTGAMERIPRERFDTLPKWVSRVFPPALVIDYNDWFGRYVHGWWNAQITKRDVHLPARDDVFGILLADGRFVWFVDHTSPNRTDASMTGFTYFDSRTGAMTYFTSSGGEYNSTAAEDAVGGNPVIKQGRLLPTQPVLYSLFGQNTWVVPAVADNGKFQTLALVQAAGGHVVVGNSGAPSPSQDAFASYRAYLGESAGGRPTPRIAGVIDRFAVAGGRVWFTLRGRRGVFTIVDAAGPDVLLARPGDRVSFETAPDESGAQLVHAFADASLAR